MKKAMLIAGMLSISFPTLAQSISLSLTPTNGYVGQIATVSYQASPQTSTWYDYIGYYRKGDPLHVTVLWSLRGASTGTKQVTLGTAGDFVMQYYDQSGVALTPPLPFSVSTGGTGYSLTVETNYTVVGDQLAVSVQSATNLSTKGDVVGYFSTTSTNSFISAVDVGWTHDVTVYFTLDRPGTFGFGYFKGGDISKPATPISYVTVGDVPGVPFTATLSPNGSNLRLSWFGYNGFSYRVHSSTNAAARRNTWPIITTVPGTTGAMSILVSPSGAQRFFFIEEVQ